MTEKSEVWEQKGKMQFFAQQLVIDQSVALNLARQSHPLMVVHNHTKVREAFAEFSDTPIPAGNS